MTDITPQRAAELLANATPGPWRTEFLLGGGNKLLPAIIAGTPNALRVIGSNLREPDGLLVAAAPDLARAYLDAVAERDALKKQLAQAQAKIDRLDDMWQSSPNTRKAVTDRYSGLAWALDALGDHPKPEQRETKVGLTHPEVETVDLVAALRASVEAARRRREVVVPYQPPVPRAREAERGEA